MRPPFAPFLILFHLSPPNILLILSPPTISPLPFLSTCLLFLSSPYLTASLNQIICVCVSVCLSVTGLQSTSFNQGIKFFGLSDPWDMRKKRIFLFFEIFMFTLFIGTFRFFPYITLVNFLSVRNRATEHTF